MAELKLLEVVPNTIWSIKKEVIRLGKLRKELNKQLADGSEVVTRKILDTYKHKTEVQPSKEKFEVKILLAGSLGKRAVENGSYFVKVDNDYIQVNKNNYQDFIDTSKQDYCSVGCWKEIYEGKTYGVRYQYPIVEVLKEVDFEFEQSMKQCEYIINATEWIQKEMKYTMEKLAA